MARLGTTIARWRKEIVETDSGEPVIVVREVALREDGAVLTRLKVGEHDYGWNLAQRAAKPTLRTQDTSAEQTRRMELDERLRSRGYAEVR